MLGWGVPGVWSCDCAVDSTLKTKSMDLIYLASPAHKLIPDVLWIVREYHVHKEVYHTQISIQKWVTCERSSWAMWNIKNQWWSGELMRLEPPGCRCEEHPGWWLEREEEWIWESGRLVLKGQGVWMMLGIQLFLFSYFYWRILLPPKHMV